MPPENEEEVVDRGDDFTPTPDEEPTEPAEAELPTEPKDDEPKDDEPKDDEPKEEAAEEVVADVSIPKSRFDEVNNKRKEAEDRMREMETKMAVLNDRQERADNAAQAQAEPEPVLDRKGLRLKMNEAILDGNMEDAGNIQDQLDQDLIKSTNAYADERMQAATQNTNEDRRFEKAADEIVGDYAEFQDKSDKFDQGLLDEVIELKDAFVAKGMYADEALRKAAAITTRGLDKVGATKAPAAKAKKTDVPKNIDTANKQPPQNLAGQGNGTTSGFANLDKMTDAEFAALPASKLAEMRGDVL